MWDIKIWTMGVCRSMTDCKIWPYLNNDCVIFETGTLTHLFHPGPCSPRFPSWTTSCRTPSSSTYHVSPRPRWHLKGQEVVNSFQDIPRYSKTLVKLVSVKFALWNVTDRMNACWQVCFVGNVFTRRHCNQELSDVEDRCELEEAPRP